MHNKGGSVDWVRGNSVTFTYYYYDYYYYYYYYYYYAGMCLCVLAPVCMISFRLPKWG